MTTRRFSWRMSDAAFIGCSEIILEIDYTKTSTCQVVFDQNIISYNEFGDASTTLVGYSPVFVSIDARAEPDPTSKNRRVYDMTLPPFVYRHLIRQELRLVLPDEKDKSEPAKLLLIENLDGTERVVQTAILV